jgi:hypothetical protein
VNDFAATTRRADLTALDSIERIGFADILSKAPSSFHFSINSMQL